MGEKSIQKEDFGKEIFSGIFGYREIKETILLQLVSNLKVLLVGDSLTAKNTFVKAIRENFDFVNCIENLNHKNISLDKSLLASAKPVSGRFDISCTIAEQISLSPVFLNKFDVLFILRDMPNKKIDRKVAESLFEKSAKPDLTQIKEKIERCRKIKVSWKDEAKKQLADFYVELRNKGNTKKITHIIINPRQLITLRNMAEGYARLNEREEVLLSDVEKAIKLMKFYFYQVGYDDD